MCFNTPLLHYLIVKYLRTCVRIKQIALSRGLLACRSVTTCVSLAGLLISSSVFFKFFRLARFDDRLGAALANDGLEYTFFLYLRKGRFYIFGNILAVWRKLTNTRQFFDFKTSCRNRHANGARQGWRRFAWRCANDFCFLQSARRLNVHIFSQNVQILILSICPILQNESFRGGG